MSQIAAKTWHFLKENTQGTENGECRFRYEIAGGCLHFCFEVEDGDIISPYGKDNDDIWEDDAVEVFLSPSGDPARYKEIEVSPFGVRFYGDIRNPDGNFVLEKIAPAYEAHAYETETGYRVTICLPFPEGFDKEKFIFNAFRLDKKRDGRQLLYALTPTLCGSFHRPGFLR